MRLATLFAAAVLPLGLMAAPVDDCNPPAPTPTEDAGSGDDGSSKVPTCAVAGGSEYVNCRDEPSTTGSVVTRLTRDETYGFKCVKKGECITIDEFTNCGWDYVPEHKCYINGHYTDDQCTLDILGWC